MTITFAVTTGLLPVTTFHLPSYLVCLGTREEIHKAMDSILNSILQQPSWKDIPHGIPLQAKWLYAHKALGMSAEQIYGDPDLNSILEHKNRADVPQIRHAIRNIDRLLGGQPRRQGRPKVAKC